MIDVIDDDQKKLAVGWIRENSGKIRSVFGNDGCGCCVDSYHIDCDDDISPLPYDIRCEDDWTSDGENRCPALTVDEVIADILRHVPAKRVEG